MQKSLSSFTVKLTAIALFLFFFASVSEIYSQTIAGHWEGEIELPNIEIEIDVDFSIEGDKTLTGDLSIPAQGAKDLPLAEITISENQLSFKLPDVPGDARFEGKISGDGSAISGRFYQSGGDFPFTLLRAESPSEKAKKSLAGFDQFIEQAIKDWNVPGLAITIVHGDKVVFQKGFGYRDLENKLPVTPNTLFAIGSATKAFTAFVLGEMVDEGKMDWDKPLRNYIPDFKLYDPFASQLISPRDLATHRSGLPRHDKLWYNNHKLSRAEIVRRLRYLEPNEDLRTKFQYNNLMFLTAGYLAECLTGMTWEEAVQKMIFEPLEMKRSNCSVRESQKSDDFALPYKEKNDTLKRIPFREIDVVGPAGSINSTVDDLSRWLILHLNGGKYKGKQIINSVTLKDIHTPYMTTGATQKHPEISTADYALGWFADNYRGHSRLHHGGNIDGFTAFVTFFPNDGIGMAVLVNKEGSDLPQIIARHAADRILNLEPIDWNEESLERRKKGKKAEKEGAKLKDSARKTGTKPAHPLDEYAGDYEHPGYGTLSVRKVDDRLEFTFNDITTPLEHWHYEVFNALKAEDDAFENMKLQFGNDLKGNVASVSVPFEPAVSNIVFTKKPDAKYFDADYLRKFTGDYDLAGRTVSIDLKGNELLLIVPGQPPYAMVPDLSGEFVLKVYSEVSVGFTTDSDGNAKSLILKQPDGIIEARKKDE